MYLHIVIKELLETLTVARQYAAVSSVAALSDITPQTGVNLGC